MSITLDPNDLAATRTSMGVGDAATKTVGTANGNLIAADAVGLPAINGSQVTNLTAANLTGALPAISGAALTNLPSSGGGAWSVKSSGTFSSTAALEITGLTKTTTLYYNARCTTQNGLAIRTSINNGTSYASTSGDYQQVGYSAASGVTTFAFSTLAAIFLNQTVQPAFGDVSGWFTIFNPADATTTQMIGQMYGQSASGAPQYGSTVHAMRASGAAVDAIKFDFNGAAGASFASGSFCVIELN
jgi:hypothetical protein